MSRPPPRILVVDDDQTAREVIEALLFADRYELVFAQSGPEALVALGQRGFDLVLCDVMMPEMDGFELCRRVRAHAEWRFIPVILTTSLDGLDDMVRGVEAGADELITKPLNRIVLRARVRAMLRVRETYGELRATIPDLESLQRARRQRLADDAGLSEREREVLELLLLGHTHDEIGAALGISGRTAKFHQSKLLEKLGADSRVDLMRMFS